MDNIQPLDGSAEDRVLVVQPRRLLSRDKELRAVGVRTGICHTDCVRFVVLERGELVFKLFSPDTFATGTVAEGIAGLLLSVMIRLAGSTDAYLDHEFSNHAMEDDVVVVAILCMRDKVLYCLRRGVREESHMDVAVCCVDNCRRSAFCRLCLELLAGVDIARLLVLDVTPGLTDAA